MLQLYLAHFTWWPISADFALNLSFYKEPPDPTEAHIQTCIQL